jgi:hypothetical protein
VLQVGLPRRARQVRRWRTCGPPAAHRPETAMIHAKPSAKPQRDWTLKNSAEAYRKQRVSERLGSVADRLRRGLGQPQTPHQPDRVRSQVEPTAIKQALQIAYSPLHSLDLDFLGLVAHARQHRLLHVAQIERLQTAAAKTDPGSVQGERDDER